LSLDPNKLTQSSGLNRSAERSARIARQIAQRRARQQLYKFIRKRSPIRKFFRRALRKLIAKAIKKIGTIIVKAMVKMLVTIASSLAAIVTFIGWPVLILVVVIVIVAFLAVDLNFDGKDDRLTILPQYQEVSMTTIDASKPEQLEWRVPTGLIAAFVQITQLRRVQDSVSSIDPTTVPENFIPIYKAAEAKYGTPWYLLAAIHRVETSFSTDPKMVSSVGAVGHFQFMKATWVGWKYAIDDVGNVDPSLDITSLQVIRDGGGYGVDGDGDGRADPWNLYDATFSAANYLAKNGVNQNMQAAVYQYNHSYSYVSQVISLAEYYKNAGQPVHDPQSENTVVEQPADSAIDKFSYKGLAQEAVQGIEPNINYDEYEAKIWEYTVIKTVDEEGNVSSSESAPKVVGRKWIEKISTVDTFRGNYQLEYETFPGEYKLVRVENRGKNTYYVYQMEEEVREVNRFYSPNYNKLIAKAQSLGFSLPDFQLFLLLFNSQVSPDAEEYTNRLPIEIEGYTDNGGNRYEMGEGEEIPKDLLAAEYVWPVPTIHRISSGFGMRPGGMHRGIDISNGNSAGHAVYAMADGVVIHAGPRDPNGFGQAVYIYHGNGLYTRYGHLQWNAYGVKTGQKVKKGQYIGRIGEGKVGSSTGPHLHFEVIINGSHTPSGNISGKWINPLQFVRP